MIRTFNYFRYTWYDLKCMRRVRKTYYRDPKFAAIDRAILSKYRLRSPYRMSRRYLKCQREKDIHTYGETPLSTFEKIAEHAEIQPKDTLLELGCGRGRGAFFLAHFSRCQVIGIERIPQFVKLAEHVARTHRVQNIRFICANMLKVAWPKASIIYLYGTCLQDSEIDQVLFQLKSCPRNVRIISVSYPLTEYDATGLFQLEKTFSVRFPWGKTKAFLHTKTAASR